MLDVADLIGKEFEYGGRGPKYDCWGLCVEVLRRAGVQLPDLPYSISDSGAEIASVAAEFHGMDFERLAGPEPLCLVTFRTRPPYVTHVGVVLEDMRRFIHISGKTRVCIERLDSMMWLTKVEGFYRWKN